MLKRIALAAVALVAVFAVVVATRPDTFSVTRSRAVAAPPDAVYAQVADFHRWAAWSPWESLDPNMQKTFAGAGSGATYSWKGNKQVGSGRMTFLGLKPPKEVQIKLEFFEPYQSASLTTFTFAPQNGGTLVTWNMTGPHNLMSKAMSMFMSFDKMIGPDFERGLAALAKASEPATAAR